VLDDEPHEALGNWECKQRPLPTDSITGFKLPFSTESAADPNNCEERVFNPVASNFTPGGLAGVWARENTRKEIFAALKRRETFATSGSRMRIRTLASSKPFPGNICEQLASGVSPIEEGLVEGVPMGGTLEVKNKGPYIVAYAIQDPGGEEAGVPLQRLELIKTWADSNGDLRQQVLKLAENATRRSPIPIAAFSNKARNKCVRCFMTPNTRPAQVPATMRAHLKTTPVAGPQKCVQPKACNARRYNPAMACFPHKVVLQGLKVVVALKVNLEISEETSVSLPSRNAPGAHRFG